jgi:uncharacterized protein YkwD
MFARRLGFRRGVVLALVGAFLAVPAPASAGSDIVAVADLETAVAKRINTVRKNRGLPTVAVRAPLAKAARQHAGDMALHGYFSHDWSTGASFSRWIKRYWPGPGYGNWSAGENLLWSSPAPSAAEVVADWMASPGHRANLLNRRWRAVGLGVVWTETPFRAYAGMPDATIVAAEFGFRSR